MNIYNTNPEWNPDYPVPNGYGFEQYCYQQAAPSMEYYYTGQGIYPVNNDPYSRRNQPTPAQQPAPFAQSNGIPQAPAAGWGFNQLAEARRMQQPTAPAPGFSAPQQQQYQNPWGAPAQVNFAAGPWDVAPQIGYSSPAPYIDPAYVNAAMAHQNAFSVQPMFNAPVAPAIDWTNKNSYAVDTAKYEPVQFQQVAQIPVQQNLLDQVKMNFADHK